MEQTYAVGSVVWVKITGGKWWPGEVVSPDSCPDDVTKGLKKDPLFIVKFFDEDYYELVKTGSHIQPFLCPRSVEFVKKGRELLKCDPHLEKFDKDVAEAEHICGAISDFSMNVESISCNLDTSGVSNHVGSPFSEDRNSHGSALVSSSILQPKNTSEQKIEFNQSFGGDVDVRIRTQVSPAPSPRSMNYLCDVCGFQTSRIANIILHHKSHSELYRHWSGKGSSDLKDRSVFSDGRLPRPKDNSKAVQRCKRKLMTNDDKLPRKKKTKKSDVDFAGGDLLPDGNSKIRSNMAEESKRQKKKKENDSDAVFEKIKRQAIKKMNRKRGGGGGSFVATSSLTGMSVLKGLKGRDGISDESSDDEEFLITREDFDSKGEDEEEPFEEEEEGKELEGIADSEPKEAVGEKEKDVDDIVEESGSGNARLVIEDKTVSDNSQVEMMTDVNDLDKAVDFEPHFDKAIDTEPHLDKPGVVAEENSVDMQSVDCASANVESVAKTIDEETRKKNEQDGNPVVNAVGAAATEKDGVEVQIAEARSKVGEGFMPDPNSCPITDVEGQLSVLLSPLFNTGGKGQTGGDHSYDAKPVASASDGKHDWDSSENDVGMGESEMDVVPADGDVCAAEVDVAQPPIDFAAEECVVEQQDPELPPLPPPLPPSPPPPPPPPPSVDFITLAEDVIIDPGDIPLPSEAEPPGRAVIEEQVPVLEYTKLEALIQPPDMGSVYLETSMEAPLVEGDEIIHLGNEQVIDSSMDVFCNEIVIESDDKYTPEDYDNICLLADAERAKTENSNAALLVSGMGDEQSGKVRIGGNPFSSAEDAINGSSRLLGSGDGQAQALARKQAGLGQAR